MGFVRTIIKALVVFALFPFAAMAVEASNERRISEEALLWVQQAEPEVGIVTYTDEVARIYESFSFSPIWHDYRPKTS